MKLPKHKLEEIDFYFVNSVNNFPGYSDVITIHWKQWWKLRTKLSFLRSTKNIRYSEELDDRIYTYVESRECAELRAQLKEYFE